MLDASNNLRKSLLFITYNLYTSLSNILLVKYQNIYNNVNIYSAFSEMNINKSNTNPNIWNLQAE